MQRPDTKQARFKALLDIIRDQIRGNLYPDAVGITVVIRNAEPGEDGKGEDMYVSNDDPRAVIHMAQMTAEREEAGLHDYEQAEDGSIIAGPMAKAKGGDAAQEP